ncbi:hypothetical protein TRFO_05921 [Tritrichomonas foetus]|uniref:Uncharacterized protein n=1 Tax=Tritrichomonas foetus TaxID=1144522 RepID=A0A1J4K3D2_9EUKA|nr:hypothetical protein TRFO_05921 [Tritrichomonas foetus]|eukprot:OHT05344.1 hypothetical protein TRFO_05921 [Tritrichomonas foetus]
MNMEESSSSSMYSQSLYSENNTLSSSIESMSDNEFNMMQNEILISGQKLEPLINAYAKNHKLSNSFLPIQNLFDLFKRELKMNLILRQNLIKERNKIQSISQTLKLEESQKQAFFDKISHYLPEVLSNYEEATEYIIKNSKLFKQSNKFEKKKNEIYQIVDSLKEENQRLIHEKEQIKESFEFEESQRLLEMTQLLSTNEVLTEKNSAFIHQIDQLHEKCGKYEAMLKTKDSMIEELKNKIDHKKRKNSTLKKENNELKSTKNSQINDLQAKMKMSKTINDDLTSQNLELKTQLDESSEKLQKANNELSQLRIKIKKIELIEDDYSNIKKKNQELKKKLANNEENEAKCEKYEEIIHESKDSIINLRKKCRHFRLLSKELASQLEQQKNDQEASKDMILKLKARINNLDDLHQQAVNEIQSQHLLQSEATNNKLLTLEEKFHSIQKNYRFCAAENKRLVFQLREVSSDINRLESENAKLQTKVERLERDLSDSQDIASIGNPANFTENDSATL